MPSPLFRRCHRRRRPLAVAAAALALACSSGTLDPELRGVRVVLDASEVQSHGVIGFRVVNGGSATVYVTPCGDRVMTAVDRRAGLGWEQLSGDACLAVYSTAPIPVAPGQSRASARNVYDAGVYRLRVGVRSAPTAPAEWDLASESFRVR